MITSLTSVFSSLLYELAKDFFISKTLISQIAKGYIFLSEEGEKNYKKSINGNFLKKTKPRIIQKLKSKGAISYCDDDDYNPFHK